MPDLTVPEQHARGFSRIIGLSADESDRVEKALSQAQSINLKELTDLVVTALPLLTREEAREIVDALLSLYSLRTAIDMKIDSFVAALLEAAQQQTTGNGSGHIAQPAEVIRTTLRDLLSVRPLSMIAK